MKVVDLRCAHDHRFEGWFASEEAFESQRVGKLITCPICNDTQIERLPSAPRLNLSGAQAPREVSGEPATAAVDPAVQRHREQQAQWMRAVREVIANTENVGERFAEEARRIHYQESPERPIRGIASREEARELAEEGIEVVALPVPAALKGTLQ